MADPRILIDGYNLLHASHVIAQQGQGELHFARLALLSHLAYHLAPATRALTTIVFDAKDAPRHLPAQFSYQQINVLFARNHPAADDLIEELIRRHSHPRSLQVVSNDRRLQRAAQRRRAQPISCDTWLDTIRQARSATSAADASAPRSRGTLPLNGSDSDAKRLILSAGTETSTSGAQWLELFQLQPAAYEQFLAQLQRQQAVGDTAAAASDEPSLPQSPPPVAGDRAELPPIDVHEIFSAEYLAELKELERKLRPPRS